MECYNASPQNFTKFHPINSSHSPDILSNKVFAELDLVASSLHGTNTNRTLPTIEPTRHSSLPPKVIITPDDAIAKILESEAVILPSEILCADINKEVIKPNGYEENLLSEESLETLKEEEETELEESAPNQSTPTNKSNNNALKLSDNPVSLPKLSDEKLDSVLDSISHDLDYLLNRSGEIDEKVQTPSLRRVSKPPGASVKNKIPEELLKDESEGIPESVTLRTEC